MHQNSTLFAKILTEAIYKIKIHDHSSIGIIQDEVGYALGRNGGRPIEYWRQGNVPKKAEDIHRLAEILLERRGLTSDLHSQLLNSAGLLAKQNKSPQQGQPQADKAGAKKTQSLLRDSFQKLVGRQTEIDRALGNFERQKGYHVVGIDGMGGIGKTALAIEIAKQGVARGMFNHIVMLTANSSLQTTPLNSSTSSRFRFDFDYILQEIGLQLGVLDMGKLNLDQKIQRIQDVFSFNNVVVILDNLETSNEPQIKLLQQINAHFNRRAFFILTSRRRFAGDIYLIHLEGLNKEEGFLFFRQDALEKGIQHAARAENHELNPLIQRIGGSPLAIKLIVSQLDHLPLEQVIHNLELRQINVNNEYVSFYKFILEWSWSLQTKSTQELLVALACFSETDGSTFDAIRFVTDLDLAQLTNSMDSLWHSSLIEVGQDSIQSIRYYLHPLTSYFVLSDIVKMSIP